MKPSGTCQIFLLLLMLLLCSIACAIDPTGTILEIKLPNSNRHVVFPVTAKELNDQLRDYPWLTHLPVGKASWQIWDIGNGSDARVYNLRADRTLRVAIIGKTNDYSFFLFYGRCDGKPPAYPRFVMVKTLDEVLVQFGAFVSNEFAELDKLYTENGKPLQELPVDLFEPTKPPSISYPSGIKVELVETGGFLGGFVLPPAAPPITMGQYYTSSGSNNGLVIWTTQTTNDHSVSPESPPSQSR